MIDRVTFTGADDYTDVGEMLRISAAYPWVEWGILFSKSHQGQPRYPSKGWIAHLATSVQRYMDRPKLSAHLCGRIMRDTLRGITTWSREYPEAWQIFKRAQLNFHAAPQLGGYLDEMRATYPSVEWIYQVDGNDDWVKNLVARRGGSPLFDRSGGAGAVPDAWPLHWHGVYCGYAGGLGPANIVDEIERIGNVCAPFDTGWIDMERRVRSDDDRTFDLDRVLSVILLVEPYISKR